MKNEKVVVTGIGSVSSLGRNSKELFESLIQKKSGIKECSFFLERNFPTGIGAESVSVDHLLKEKEKNLPRPIKNLMVASDEAVTSTDPMSFYKPWEMGAYIAGPGCSIFESERFYRDHLKKGFQATRVKDLAYSSMDAPLHELCLRHGIEGPRSTILTACSSSAVALGLAYDLIKIGAVRAMFVGGTDGFSELTYAGFNSLKSIADGPCTPFDKDRQGLSFGEGAGILILESEETAKKRGAPILAEMVGHGSFGEGYNLTSPHPEGIGYIQSMTKALKMAKLNKEDVDHINAHGTATPLNDKVESFSIGKVFGPNPIPVNSIKGSIGHCMGAAGALEAVNCIMTLKTQIIPGTTNLKEVDPTLKVNVLKKSQERKINTVLCNSAGFGGNNGSVIFKRNQL